VAFDPLTEHFQLRHLWVLLPRLPIHLWNEGALKAIENALGRFISLDNSSLQNTSRKMGRILVEVDIHEGLPEVMDIEWCGHHIKQRLDYQGIPFRCSFCHCTGHLQRECSGKIYEEKLEDTLLQEDPPDYMMEVDSLGEILFHCTNATRPPLESLDSLSSKLSLFYPTLYYSLSLCEKEALDNSRWLSHTTSVIKGTIVGDLEPFGTYRMPLAPVFDVGRPADLTIAPIIYSFTTLHPSNHPHSIQLSDHLVSRSRVPTPSHSLPPTNFMEPLIEPSGREPKKDENALSTVLDSLIPFLKDNKEVSKLMIFLGKKTLAPEGSSEASSSKTILAKGGKYFAWSRGMGLELSPLKMQSGWKKKSQAVEKT